MDHPIQEAPSAKVPGESSDRLKTVTQIVGPLAGLLAGLISHQFDLIVPASITLGVAVWTTLWWVFEAIPIPVTSLIPLALLPLLGVLTGGQVASAYGHPLVLLLLGGFLLSKAMEKSGAHRRIALGMVNACGGGGGKSLVLGFMLASAVLSMWISNTATTLMMLPMAVAVIQNSNDPRLKIPLLLGIAYAANVGGIGTPIGTPPNLVMIAAYRELGNPELSFGDWMKVGVPVSLVMVAVIWLWLTRKLKGTTPIPLPDPGSWRKEEIFTLGVFALTALAWMTRGEPFGGWQALFQLKNANDASVAFVAVILLFCLPNGMGKGEKLLDWKTANEIPWGMLVLVGAGLCLGVAFKESGLSATIASVFSGLKNVPLIVLLLGITLLVTFLTEMTSNTATTNVLMPILGAVAVASDLDPMLLMLPAAISASCAFMLPVATIPNAVVFSTGEITVKKMASEGLVLNFFGAGVVTLICFLVLR